jgi:hypothetical protein
MKPIAIIVAASAVASVAHAEQFDLVCDTRLTVEITGRPSSAIDQDMRFSLNTESRTIIRRHGTDHTPIPLEVLADRYLFRIGQGEWVIDRATNQINAGMTSSDYLMSLTGNCLRQPSAAE